MATNSTPVVYKSSSQKLNLSTARSEHHVKLLQHHSLNRNLQNSPIMLDNDDGRNRTTKKESFRVSLAIILNSHRFHVSYQPYI